LFRVREPKLEPEIPFFCEPDPNPNPNPIRGAIIRITK